MDNTNVLAEFIIIGDQFPLHEISQQLSVNPTYFYNKGDITKHKIVRQETVWCTDTGYEESVDINDQLDKIIKQFKPKKEILLELKEKYALKFKFMVVINIEDLMKPAIYLSKETIQFFNSISACIEFDYYIYTD